MTKKKTLREALAQVSLAVKKLEKDQRNDFGGYEYTSIDNYYEGIVQAASDAGLWWHLREGEIVVLNPNVKSPLMSYQFHLDLMHDDETMHDFDKLTVHVSLTGGQTAGIARSFAEKAFIRSLFKIRTGDDDGGAQPPVQQSIDIPQQDGNKEITEAERVSLADKVAEIRSDVLKTNTKEDLLKVWMEHDVFLKDLKEKAEDMYDALTMSFKEHKKALGDK